MATVVHTRRTRFVLPQVSLPSWARIRPAAPSRDRERQTDAREARDRFVVQTGVYRPFLLA